MPFAPLPDHNRTDDPLWRRLFHGYRHVVTPLRANGWTTDIELCGGEHHIRADLGDGTELVIASVHPLSADLNEVDGWKAVRQETGGSGTHTCVYDSTPGGAQRHHGTGLVPLFARLAELEVRRTTARLIVSATHTNSFGANHNQTAGIEAAGVALARYFDWCQLLVTEAYRPVWERPEYEGYPLALFEKAGGISTVRVTPWHGDGPRRWP
ncbi:hypothetical protein K7472_08115 [Streptomyces sp. PTM05]|uniref:Uncharacterized protein n=1 Tax=Streptantibioticus parmotrematis TaxID=2873249 RepID=A0ABS7QNQ0_9ACTN|nr:hypothetical protein [Streptantibioticus parmotrematis]MBY8884810.1 hypothetical protein [Streptantibioticus parmotrematis]